MKAGRFNISIPDPDLLDQCPARITLKDDDGNKLWTVPCNKPPHPPASGHKFVFEWNDVFSDKPLTPDPPRMRVIRSEDNGIIAAINPKEDTE